MECKSLATIAVSPLRNGNGFIDVGGFFESCVTGILNTQLQKVLVTIE